MEQLGLGTIEITHRMFCQLKEEFENIYFEQYIDCYKLTNFDDLFNKQIINFYYLLLKYVFKSQIYIYNISFLLDVRKSIIIIVRGNLEKLLSDIDNLKEKEFKERIDYILKMFLDVLYVYIIEKKDIKTKNLDNTIKKLIHEKKFNKIRNKKAIFTLLNDKKISERISKLFTKDEIDTFKNKYNINNDLSEINNYFKNYFFQSKQKDIIKITKFLQGNINLKYKEKKEYLKDLNIAKEMNNKYKFFNNIFELKNIENEEEIKNIFNKIDKMLSEKNIDIFDDEKKIKLFKFINNKSDLKKFEALLKEDLFEFLENEKNKVLNEILLYFKTFCPESKKNEIESIENDTFKNDIFNEYSFAKKRNIRKECIFLYIDNKNLLDNEEEIQRAVQKWNKIEKDEKFENFNYFSESATISLNQSRNNTINSAPTTTSSDANNKNKNKKKDKRKSKSNGDLSKLKKNLGGGNAATTKIEKNNDLGCVDEELEVEDRIELIYEAIKKGLTLKLKGKEEKIIEFKPYVKRKCLIHKYDMDKGKKYYSNNNKSEQYIIFDYLNEFLSKLIKEFNNNYELVIKISITKNDDNDFVFLLEFFPPCNGSPKYFKDFNYLSEGFLHLIEEINSEKYKNTKLFKNNNNISKIIKQETTNNDKTQNMDSTQSFNNISVNMSRANMSNKEQSTTYQPQSNKTKDKNNKYEIISFQRYLYNYNSDDKGMNTADFCKELNGYSKYYIIGGSSGSSTSTLKVFGYNFYPTSLKDIKTDKLVHSIFQRKNLDGKIGIFSCELKNLVIYDLNNDTFKPSYPVLDNDEKSFVSIIEFKQEKKENNTILITAGNGGVTRFNNPFGITDSKLEIYTESSCIGLIQIDEKRIAFTSNMIIPNGTDNLFIYDLDAKVLKSIDNHSFIASPNGLAVFDFMENNDKKLYLICACKKYVDGQENGILLVNIKNELKNELKKEYAKYFYKTDEFEVYCICQICDMMKSGTISISFEDKGEGTEFFLVGGFDKINRKGAIKLFKIKGDKVVFLQDIINKIYVAPLNIYKKIGDQSISLSSQSTKSSSQNQFKNDNQSIDNINIEEDTKFKGFEGAVTSIMQSMSSYEIVATCSDGKVSLFSCPNLEIYGKKLFINNS